MHPVYTVGHSNHDPKDFARLLQSRGIALVADVRSHPYSRFPHFNREALEVDLRRAGIRYVFLGRELGARRQEPEAWVHGEMNWAHLQDLPLFSEGLKRIAAEARTQPLALLCAEKEPLECHRAVLVCRHLRTLGLTIRHLLADGSVEEHARLEQRMVQLAGIERTLFDSDMTDAQLVERAYDECSRKLFGRAARSGGLSDEQSSITE